VIPSCLLVVCFENWFESKCKRAAKDSLLPSKYKCEYEETYNVYRNWSSIKKIKTCEDSEVSIPFLKRKGEGYKPKKFLVKKKFRNAPLVNNPVCCIKIRFILISCWQCAGLHLNVNFTHVSCYFFRVIFHRPLVNFNINELFCLKYSVLMDIINTLFFINQRVLRF
jgi:hypothetical protein